MRTTGNEAGEMRHVDHQICTDRIGDGAKPREIDDARIGGSAGDDQLRPMLAGKTLDLVDIDLVIVAANAVLYRPEPLARHVRRGTMGEVSTSGKRHAENDIARRS